ncbi:unnamed protein product [Scytosiphon promiscuus]
MVRSDAFQAAIDLRTGKASCLLSGQVPRCSLKVIYSAIHRIFCGKYYVGRWTFPHISINRENNATVRGERHFTTGASFLCHHPDPVNRAGAARWVLFSPKIAKQQGRPQVFCAHLAAAVLALV